MAACRPLSIPDETDPPLDIAGMTRMTLDTKGRLVAFSAVPSQLESKAPAAAAHGLGAAVCRGRSRPGDVHEAAPARTPPTFADDRRAWSGKLPETQTR